MTNYIFPPPPINSVAVNGETAEFAINRIFCVGRNYAAHAAEMGFEVDREAPWYFTKSPSAFQPSGGEIAYPPGTENFHFEMELAVAIGKAGFRVPTAEAIGHVYAYGCGLDMTRRDLQIASRSKSRPWDLGKDTECSAVIAPLTRASEFGAVGSQRIHLEVNGETKQDAHLSDMIWRVDEIIGHLSVYYHLRPGDIILTGTPAGVGPVVAGDIIKGGIDGLTDISLTIGQPE